MTRTGAGRQLQPCICGIAGFSVHNYFMEIKKDKRKELLAIMRLQQLLSYTRKAVDEYRMIDEGDHIAVGISGEKTALRSSMPCTG